MATFKLKEAFPIIERIIGDICGSHGIAYREEIAWQVLQSEDGHALVSAAHEQNESGWTELTIAGNMIDWFSAKFESDPLTQAARKTYDRKKSNDKWAYFPVGNPPPKATFDAEPDHAFTFPEEIAETYFEGAMRVVTVNNYERNSGARKACIDHYGPCCVICGFDFSATYGPTGEGFIHVHHLIPLADIGESYKIDPFADLRPVCPNCHAVIHLRSPPYTIDEVKVMIGE